MTSYAIDLEPLKGTHSHADNTDEQIVVTLAPSGTVVVQSIWLDMSKLSKATVVRLKHKIDSSNYREFQDVTWGPNRPSGMLFSGALAVDDAVMITLQSLEAEGGQ